MTGKVSIAAVCGLGLALSASSAGAVLVTVTINQIEIDDIDHDLDVNAGLKRYFVGSAFVGGGIDVSGVPHIGVCTLRSPADNEPGCEDRITPNPGQWSFTVNHAPGTNTITVRIEIREEDPLELFPLDLSPGPLAPAEWGLNLIVDVANRSWQVRNDPGRPSPTVSSSDFLGPGAIDSHRLTGHVFFNVSFCAPGSASCSDGTRRSPRGRRRQRRPQRRRPSRHLHRRPQHRHLRPLPSRDTVTRRPLRRESIDPTAGSRPIIAG